MIRDEEGNSNPQIIQVISPYRGEFYGTGSLNLFIQNTFNSVWSEKKLDGIGYFDKVIQFRNRPQSDPAFAYLNIKDKTEAIITNLLVDRDVPFKYEEPLYAPGGTMFWPDFTVTFRGEEYYWEHIGRTNDQKYIKHWEKKAEWYKKHFPGKLLTTYEGNDLTTAAVSIIDQFV